MHTGCLHFWDQNHCKLLSIWYYMHVLCTVKSKIMRAVTGTHYIYIYIYLTSISIYSLIHIYIFTHLVYDLYLCVYIYMHTFIRTNTYHKDIWNSDTLELLYFHVLTSEDQNWCWILTFSTTCLLSLLRFVSSGTRWTSRVVSFRGLRFEQTCCSSFHLREMEKNSRVESQIYLLHSDMDFWWFWLF